MAGKHGHIVLLLLMLLAGAWSGQTLRAQLSIGPGGFITVKPGGSLMIGTDLHIKSVAGASGALADQNAAGAVTITGDALVERYLSPDTWHNVASPVSNATSAVYATDLVFWYNEALILNDWNFGWVWYTGATGGPLQVFRGYDVLFYDNPVTVNYQATGAATVNTGNYTFGVIITNSVPGEIPSHKGWNLAGNPYPSPVDWLAAGWDKSDINDVKYIWDGSNDIYTGYIGGGAPLSINGGTRFIPSNQGFWVQAVQNGTLGISNPVRIGDITGTPDFYKDAPVDYPLVSLWAGNAIVEDEAVVRFITGTTAGFDINYDASKLFSLNPAIPQLSILAGKQTLVLSTLPGIVQNLEVNLGFRSTRQGLYHLRLDQRSFLQPSEALYLRDELTGQLFDLKTDSLVHFYHDPANAEKRFTLLFNPSEDIIQDLTPDSWYSVYSAGSTVHIIKNTNRELSGEIRLFNMLGQPVYRKSLEPSSEMTFQPHVPAGYYIAGIRTTQHSAHTKIFLTKP